ncbi:MAG TPA: hypothetical protein VMT42_04660 [candidate division Zixibacteria bacterium]|nr:hypothetical protein [candidate division Zixibacteria bacterium]
MKNITKIRGFSPEKMLRMEAGIGVHADLTSLMQKEKSMKTLFLKQIASGGGDGLW